MKKSKIKKTIIKNQKSIGTRLFCSCFYYYILENIDMFNHFTEIANTMRIDEKQKRYSAHTLMGILRYQSIIDDRYTEYKISSLFVRSISILYTELNEAYGFFIIKKPRKRSKKWKKIYSKEELYNIFYDITNLESVSYSLMEINALESIKYYCFSEDQLLNIFKPIL